MIRLPTIARRLRTLQSTTSLIRFSSTSANTVSTSPGIPVKATSEEVAASSPEPSTLQKSQAPNRTLTWAKSQQPRSQAMVGPRFEQTDMELQPRPLAAIELIHEEPVRFVEDRIVVCDGGGGPLGHPKVFINVDKPEVVPCGYCGLPFAHIHNKKEILQKGQGSHGNYVLE